jgi:hypothetical protein
MKEIAKLFIYFCEFGNTLEETSVEQPHGKEKERLRMAFEDKIRWKSVQQQNNRFEAFGDTREESAQVDLVDEIKAKFLLCRIDRFE